MTNTKKATLVLSVYKEDLSWLNEIQNHELEILIINKGDHFKHHLAKCITLKNVGLCDNSFSYYLSHFYDELRDYTIFSQGHPFDHYENMLGFINNKEYENGYTPLADKTIHIPRGEGTTIFVENILDYHFPGIDFPCGAQYSVPKDIIIGKPKYFWDDIYNMLPWEEDAFTPYFMERVWNLLYDPKIKIKEGYRLTDYFTLKKRLSKI